MRSDEVGSPDRWVQATWEGLGGDASSGAAEEDAVRAWLRQLFDAEGPLELDAVIVAYELQLIERAEIAVVAVLDDARRTTNHCPSVAVDFPGDQSGPIVSISDDGTLRSACSVSLPFHPDDGELMVAMAEEVQEHMCEAYGYRVWPLCPEHGFGLHATVKGREAVWWCRHPGHRVAAIGRLGL